MDEIQIMSKSIVQGTHKRNFVLKIQVKHT